MKGGSLILYLLLHFSLKVSENNLYFDILLEGLHIDGGVAAIFANAVAQYSGNADFRKVTTKPWLCRTVYTYNPVFKKVFVAKISIPRHRNFCYVYIINN